MAETIYQAHDNSIDLILKADGVAVGTSTVTMITASFGTVLCKSTDAASGIIRWNQAGYDTGEIRMFLGSATSVVPDKYLDVPIVVYDPTNSNGVVWGTVEIDVLARVDATGAT